MRLRSALLVPLVALSTSSEAAAFCVKTTCAPAREDCPKDDDGCVTVGAPIRWGKSTLTFRFHQAGSSQLLREEARAAVRAAFFRWSDAICADGRQTSLRFVEGEDILADKPLDVGAKASEPYGIFFRDYGWPYGEEDSALAKTNTSFDKASGRILYADMEINSTTTKFDVTDSSDAVDLQAVLTHEVGHYIGLDHSLANHAIMAASYCNSQVDDRCTKGKVAARRLSDDDIDAVCALYPPDGVEKFAEESGPLSCGISPRPSIGAGGLLVGLALSISALLRRARRG